MPNSQLNPKQQLQLCQQVARLVRAKLPVIGQLSNAVGGHAPHLEESAKAVEEQVAGGQSLASALAGDPSRNSRILAACIEAGERSNSLDRILECWAGMYIANAKSTKAMRAAMVYPCLLILVMLFSLGLVIWELIPEYRATYVLFSQQMPAWLEFIVRVREQMGPLMILLLVLIFSPLVFWFFWRRSRDQYRIPREPATRRRLQSLASDLAGFMIASSIPLQDVVALTARAMFAKDEDCEQAFRRLQKQQPPHPLPHETSMLLAALHAGLIGKEEAAKHLHEVASHLRQSADIIATRNARWLPMLVALVVGGLTILTYVFLIYLPWIALMEKIVTPDYLAPLQMSGLALATGSSF